MNKLNFEGIKGWVVVNAGRMAGVTSGTEVAVAVVAAVVNAMLNVARSAGATSVSDDGSVAIW